MVKNCIKKWALIKVLKILLLKNVKTIRIDNMKILIIGMGFAGKAYYESLSYLKNNNGNKITLAYYSNKQENVNITYYESLDVSLKDYKPDMIIVAVNDIYHINILQKLKNFEGIILCEKPFVSNSEELNLALDFLNTEKQTIILSTVIRFSLATQKLKHFIESNNLSIKRINFVWKKNRINDFRPTVGVISEIIHPLDTLEWLFNDKIKVVSSIITNSNFSVKRDKYIPDSIFLSGKLSDGIITGYSSFTSLNVERSIDVVLKDLISHDHYYVKLSYDSPNWFEDTLHIYKEKKENKLKLQTLIV
ncbi:oxidoreductase [Staphylococcus sp. SNAZ 59]|nr:oxidoreductase [Staphylococcus sp. SNAZ 59]RXZ33538.1 oxidoreductase [Staphylococcus sp. SNAZ 36]RXZ41500.1 oxidoreductase [Staphylococcus sp. SNAZ 75]